MSLLLFHWMGYQALYGLWMQQSNTALENQLDNSEYNEQELVTIAIPLHLPYLTDEAEYQRLSGETVIDGITYQYVQRRVYHDSLYLQCLPNKMAMQLNAARMDCFKFTTGIQQNGSGISKPGHAFTKQFTGETEPFRVQQPAVPFFNHQVFFPASQVVLHQPIFAGPDQPPEAVI